MLHILKACRESFSPLKTHFVLKMSLVLAQAERRDGLSSTFTSCLSLLLLCDCLDIEVTGFAEVKVCAAPVAFTAVCIGELEHWPSVA